MTAGFLFALRSRKEASVHLDNSREASFWGDLTNGSSQQSRLSSRIIVLEYWTSFVQEPTSVAISAPVGRALERMARSHFPLTVRAVAVAKSTAHYQHY